MVNGTTSPAASRRRALKPDRFTIPFDAIRSPGSYICNWNGHLLRIPAGTVRPEGEPINLVGPTPLFVTKISDDPGLPLSQARELATELRVKPSF